MKKLISTSLILFLCLSLWAQKITPIEQTVGNLHFSIDPRLELLSTIQVLSNYKVIDRKSPYSKEIQTYFSKYSGHPAVQKTGELFLKYGFSYDAPPAFMLYLSPVPELKLQLPFSDYLLGRSGGKENLDNYRETIEQFARESDFNKFWNNKAEFYNKILSLTIEDSKSDNVVKIIEDYFNESQNSYNIIIAPLFYGHNYGSRIKSKNDKYDIYSCNTPSKFKDGIPYLDKESMSQIVCHEFGHSFVNPLTDKYAAKVESFRNLFSPIQAEMSQRAYGSWSTCVNEHIIRAVNIRIQQLHKGAAQSTIMLNQEKANRFVYIEPLVNKLKEYESLRDKKKITFSEFFPQLLNVFDSLSKADYFKLAEKKFIGPINLVTFNQKTAWIYPTNDKDTISLRLAKDFITMVYKRFKSEGSILISDSVALKTNLAEFGLMVYGTLESNLLLTKHRESFPFKIENNVIFADKEYKDVNTRFITCLPNPYNPKLGMSIYTAFTNANIPNINNVFHGPEDFILFTNSQNILTKGFYNKRETWEFIKE